MNLEQRIRLDTQRAAGDPEVQALLACLVQHLFDPSLDTNYLGRVCGAARDVRDRLATIVGPLKSYITELRMLEAARLMRETDLPIPEIGKRLGYRVPRTFRRAFKACHGLPPGKMRERARTERDDAPDPAAAAAAAIDGLQAAEAPPDADPHRARRSSRHPRHLAPRVRAAQLRRSLAIGRLDAAAATELRARLRRHHPQLDATSKAGDPPPADPPPGSAARRSVTRPITLNATDPILEKLTTAAIFGRLLTVPEAELRPAMLDGIRLSSPSAFEILQQLCCDCTRWNPERAVAIAELGVQLLKRHRELFGEQADDRQALAWAHLGRVQMLVGDLDGVRRSLGFAWEEIGDGATMTPQTELEVRRVEGMIDLRQGRGERATSALDRAIELSRKLPESDPARLHTLAERLELAALFGDAQAGLEFTDELAARIAENSDSIERIDFWRGLATYHRGKAHAATGRDDLAESCWRQACRFVESDQAATEPPGAAVFETAVLGSFIVHEMARLAGRLQSLEVYEILLRDVLGRYWQQRTPMLEAAAEAELAVLCALRGQHEEAQRRATSVADFLDRLPCHRRAWNAASRLRSLATIDGSARTGDELQALLAALCDDLDFVRWEITGAQAAPASQNWRRISLPQPTSGSGP